eukprot:CAMPEP_0114593420 /NCGR_PEP_ID=MMETSP0125-20121206/15025_1 /TAXON_ID=485358 ORGANISM="Aristerostoma sp., Strain ATCC 50986" /NCGR_SAMPLE_ID=MMETSP0125 /ASSEMBLY_ACC=CAM_ASM_000245 /LENGTH=82 /DNA_ID=CAMNT_0001792603 /DNA_START=332 /DNA_END=580 /DNA_ORIENTATION=+
MALKKKVKTDGTTGNKNPMIRPGNMMSSKNLIVPNHILFVEDLPKDSDVQSLTQIFNEYPGFREVRHIAIKRVAFIEYEDEI